MAGEVNGRSGGAMLPETSAGAQEIAHHELWIMIAENWEL